MARTRLIHRPGLEAPPAPGQQNGDGWLRELVASIEELPLEEDQDCASSSSTDSCTDSLSSADAVSESQSSADTALEGMRGRSSLPSDKHLRAIAKQGAADHGSKTTKRDYGRIQEEFEQFALSIHGTKTVTPDNAFEFLFYTAHRPLRNEEGKDDTELPPPKKKRRTKHVFDPQHFRLVMAEIKDRTVGEYVEPKGNRIQCIRKHFCAIQKIAPDKVRMEMSHHNGIKDLVQYVKGRKKTADALSFREKVNPQLEKFRYPELYDKVEKYYWHKHERSSRPEYVAAAFRDRFTLLSSVQCCTRFESLAKCKLSNFQFLQFHMKDEVDPYTILFRNINVGKTAAADSDKRVIIQAKSLRHKNVEKCEQGALAVSLFTRFRVTDEEFDLTDNEQWYNIHTSVAIGDGKVKDLEKAKERSELDMGRSGFYASIKKAFLKFGHCVAHVNHFGRSCSPVVLEFAEVMTCYIKELGNWDMNVFERHYSAKMAWPALRAAANFRQERGNYYQPRQRIKPPPELTKLAFPNIERAKARFRQLPVKSQMKRKTARSFIDAMDHLAEVLMQDACVFLTMPDRKDHVLFQDPLFKTPEFLSYQNRFNREYPILCNPHNDPTHDPLKRHVPLIGHTLANLNANVARGNELISMQTQAIVLMHQKQDSMTAQINGLSVNANHVNHVIDAAVTAAQNSPYRSPPRTCECDAPSGLYADPDFMQVTMIDSSPGNDSPNEGLPHDTRTEESMPEYPTLPVTYNSLQAMYNDWNGSVGSIFASCNGIKAIDSDSKYRKSLSSGQKKLLQRLNRINRFFESQVRSGQSLEETFTMIENALRDSPKKDVTLSGTADLLKKVFGWSGK